MSKYVIDSSTLTSIADAVRAKTGSTDPIKVSDIPTAISNISGGGSEGIVISGDCSFLFSDFNKFIKNYGNQISTENVSNAEYMFSDNTSITEIPFDINFNSEKENDITDMFKGCTNL